VLGAWKVWRVVHFVGEHVFCLGAADGQIQASQQLGQGFPVPSYQHRESVPSFMCHCDALCQWRNDPDTDSTQFDDLVDIGQVGETSRPVFFQAASVVACSRLAATCQGSSSSMRLTG
jgi:hypothetical protein